MTITSHDIKMDQQKLTGALVTVAGILLAALCLPLLVPLSTGHLLMLGLFVLWLCWFLLRSGIPPTRLLVSRDDQALGLSNPLSTRWFAAGEYRLEHRPGSAADLIIDDRTIVLDDVATREVERLLIQEK